MTLIASQQKQTFFFNFNAKTSRGDLKNKPSWFLKVTHQENTDAFGLGEISPLEGLSLEFDSNFEYKLQAIVNQFNTQKLLTIEDAWQYVLKSIIPQFSAICFGFESALFDLENGSKRIIFESDFEKGNQQIKINGLIWIDSFESMKNQIINRIEKGFSCIKLKVSESEWNEQIKLIEYVRQRYENLNITIRVDANESLLLPNISKKLEQLAQLNVHSIEQPIKRNDYINLKAICKSSPVPIALDEELVGTNFEKKLEIIATVSPQFLILKPSLIGGLKETKKIIEWAKKNHQKWWITSALESNIGLNAICQLASLYCGEDIQGLGTGSLYLNNIPGPLTVKGEYIFTDKSKNWDFSALAQAKK